MSNRIGHYLLDANIFIEACKRYYAFDIVPSFWQRLKQCAENGQVLSLDHIQQELLAFPEKDALKTWATGEFSSYFVSTERKSCFLTVKS